MATHRYSAAILAGFLVVMLGAQPPGPAEGNQAAPPAAPGPATTRPSAPRTTRTPAQAELLKNLLRDRERTAPVVPAPVGGRGPGAQVIAATPAEGSGLLADGTNLVERAGRLLWQGETPSFEFVSGLGEQGLREIRLLPNGLLEAMERESQGGGQEFLVSGVVTAYKGRNYLLLTKVLRRVGHGNLAP